MKSLRDKRNTLAAMLAATFAATGASTANGSGFPPTLLPGSTAIANGTHVTCQVTASTVLCAKAGGLSAKLSTTGATSVAKGTTPPRATGSATKLGTYDGFIIAGAGGHSIYCHLYVEGNRILSCAVDGGHDPGDRGFDISDRSIVLFRIDAESIRRDLKTYPQP
jgi:hypothetical protein